MKLTNELREAIENYKNGNEDAFSTIYEESKGYIYVCIANTLNGDYKNEDVIQDIMQDAYLDISKNLIKLDNTEDFLSWAATIAKRRSYDYLKKQGKYILLGEDENFDNLTDDNMLPEEVVLSKEKQDKVREVINTELTEDEKNCVVGFYYNDMKQKDIAKELDMPENTVKSNIFRAKSKMKKALSGVFVVALAACLLIFALNTNAVKEALRKIGGNEKEEAQTKATEESSEQPSDIEEFGTEIIPEGCEYHSAKTNKTYLAGEKFLKTLSYGDKLYTSDYIYEYSTEGWSLKVRNTDKTEYEAIMPTIAGKPLVSMNEAFKNCGSLIKTPYIPEGVRSLSEAFMWCGALKTVTNLPDSCINLNKTFFACGSLVMVPAIPDNVSGMSQTFYNCTSLVTVPAIPDKVTSMDDTFYKCTSLITAPKIPDTVANMSGTFLGCSSLVTAPIIPDTVNNMYYTFYGCTSLTGDIVINAAPRNYEACFKGVKLASQGIKVSGTSTILSELRATAEFENVVPEGATYYDASENKLLEAGEALPEVHWSTCQGDKYITQDYEYIFIEDEHYYIWGWNVKVKDTTKDSYEEFLNLENLNLENTFAGCINMKEAPKIPEKVYSNGLEGTFKGCISLEKAPVIPDSIVNLERTFEGCTGLTLAPVIPEGVMCLYKTFSGCTSLTGTIEINANAVAYNKCFYGIDMAAQNLTVSGSSTILDYIILTTSENEANQTVVEYGDTIKVLSREKYSRDGYPGAWSDWSEKEFVVAESSYEFSADIVDAYDWPEELWGINIRNSLGKKVGETFETGQVHTEGRADFEYTILEIIKSE